MSCSTPTICIRVGRWARTSWPTATRCGSRTPVRGRPGIPGGGDRGRARFVDPGAGRDRGRGHRGRDRPSPRPGVARPGRALGCPGGGSRRLEDGLAPAAGGWRRRGSGSRRGRREREQPSTERTWSLVANLPYNVAIPLVVRVLEEVPQVSSLLVIVQARGGRASGRPRRGRGVRGGVGQSRLLGPRLRWSAGYRPRCSSPGRRWSRCWSASTAGRFRPEPWPRCRMTGCSPWSGRDSPTAARCSAAPWTAWWTRRLTRRPAYTRPARAEELGFNTWGRLSAWEPTEPIAW